MALLSRSLNIPASLINWGLFWAQGPLAGRVLVRLGLSPNL